MLNWKYLLHVNFCALTGYVPNLLEFKMRFFSHSTWQGVDAPHPGLEYKVGEGGCCRLGVRVGVASPISLAISAPIAAFAVPYTTAYPQLQLRCWLQPEALAQQQ